MSGDKEYIPRRNRVDDWTPIEHTIHETMQLVETLGAHPLLTDAVTKLSEAQEKVADWVDELAAGEQNEAQEAYMDLYKAARVLKTCSPDDEKYDDYRLSYDNALRRVGFLYGDFDL